MNRPSAHIIGEEWEKCQLARRHRRGGALTPPSCPRRLTERR